MFKEYLLSAKSNNIPISIYTDIEDVDNYSVGFVQGVSDDWVLIASISPRGFYDGFYVEKYENVFRCESNDQYSARVYKLYKIRKQKHPKVNLKSDNLLYDLIQYAQKHQLIVFIELCESTYVDLQGFIGDINGKQIIIKQLDDDGNSDGESMISIEDITRFNCDSEKGVSIKLLVDNR